MIRKYPQISQVIKLKYPNYQKCIIILSGLDIKIDEICDVLQAAEDSISSQRSKMKNDIPNPHMDGFELTLGQNGITVLIFEK